MANAAKGEVSFEAEGKTWVLVFDFNAICDLEDALGISASELGESIGKNPKAKDLRTIFRVGLSRHNMMDDKAAGDLISAITPQRAGELMTEAFARTFPPEKGSVATDRPPAAAAA